MAVWRNTVAGFQVVINNVDHEPPHCHVFIHGRNVRVNLETLQSMSRTVPELPPRLRRSLSAIQSELLSAWQKVEIIE